MEHKQIAARPRRADSGKCYHIDDILARMERAAETLDWAAIGKADLAFHREICAVSGNDGVITLWETLARHVLILFGPQHRRVRKVLLVADPPALEAEIERHIPRLRDRRAFAGRPRLPSN